MILLGSIKLGMGLFLGGTAIMWMTAFPAPLLGVFLVLSGLALAEASRFWTARHITGVTAAMVAAHLATGMLAVGFGVGWALYAGWQALGERREKDGGGQPV